MFRGTRAEERRGEASNLERPRIQRKTYEMRGRGGSLSVWN